ncbi:MAG TPA: YhdP family protein [Burkholderiales bacterium]|nr:YhdP family protein [Burkholderiales bacterium]
MPESLIKWLRFHVSWMYRVATWLVLLGGVVFAIIVISVQYWLLPRIGDYRETVAQDLSAAAHQRITIGRIEGYWDGLRLTLALGDVTVYDKTDHPALVFKRIESSLSWWSFFYLEPRLHSIEIEQPSLNIARSRDGVITVAGIEVNAAGGGGFSDWLLRQDRIVIRDARISWQDDQRSAPPLELRDVYFRLDSNGRHHRFGLRAAPPAPLAAPLDVRGDLRGGSVTDLAQWSGRLFARLDYVDIAAWRTWLPFPVTFPRGIGAARVWADLDDGRMTGITADLELSQVQTRLGPDVKELDLQSLKGRLAWQSLPDGFEFSTTHLALATRDGVVLPATDFLLRYQHASGSKLERGELRANEIRVESLLALADYLPLDEDLRREIAGYAPRGKLNEVAIKWDGSWPQPRQYSIKSSFTGVGLRPVGRLPGFAGLSGRIDGNESGGTLYLDAENVTADLPLVFSDSLSLESLTARVVWDRSGDQYTVKLNNVAFANADVAGSVYGVYRTAAVGKGAIDLSGNLTRADARRITRYIPLQVAESARHWLDGAFLAGEARDVQLRLKGDLDRFPFADNGDGLFRVAIKASGLTLDYAKGWPKIENISGDVIFSGRRMEVAAREGSMFGVRLGPVRAEIPDLDVHPRTLSIDGAAEGPTSDFLAFIANSPTLDTVKYFTEKIRAEGNGRLLLKMMMPLDHASDARISGGYQFVNNRLVEEGVIPPLEHVNGRLEFTESGMHASGIAVNFLGGPATISVVSGADGATRITTRGHADFENLRRSPRAPSWAQLLHGATDWKGDIVLNSRRQVDLVIESTLQGVVSELPAPLAKVGAESVPFRIERHVVKMPRERITFLLGDVVSAQLIGRDDSGRFTVERGSITFGNATGMPARRGLTINGAIASLDFDGWLGLLEDGGDGMLLPDITAIDLRIGNIDVHGRAFHDFAINGAMAPGGVLRATVNGQEIAGDVSWRSQPEGKRLQARLRQLTIPARRGGDTASAAATSSRGTSDLPTVDFSAENFTLGDKALGRLELLAAPEQNGWRIDKLHISNPDATLQIDGLWKDWLAHPHTEANVHLEVNDIGKLLLRLGQPQGVKRGTAQLDGALSWDGAPYNIDYKTMSGNLVVDAKKGQFTKLDPGVGRLLGILSLQSLPRRITLDFRDIFSQGLAFDEIIGAVKISRGLASTDSLRIQSPSARIVMNGSVDLTEETQNLHVKITPSVSDSVSVAGALIGGPIAGVAAWVAQKLLKDPLDQMASYEYNISGNWNNPQVAKIEPYAQGLEKTP